VSGLFKAPAFLLARSETEIEAWRRDPMVSPSGMTPQSTDTEPAPTGATLIAVFCNKPDALKWLRVETTEIKGEN
jgi:hypothetical protein